MQGRSPAVHRTIMVVDVEGFGDRQRTNPRQVIVREALYGAVQQAFAKAGIPWTACEHEDRGDGLLVHAPAQIPKTFFVEGVPLVLAAALREHNQTHPIEERIRLRMALHAGEVHLDDYGVAGTAVNLTFRLLDAQPLKTALADSAGVLALIASSWFFEDVVRHSPTAHAETFRPVRVEEKETSTVAWIALPDHPYPRDPSALTAPPPDPVAGSVPRQLPAAPGSFIGRRDELAALNAAGGPGGAVVISAIGGAGGIGKTALALHWAHHHLHRFPDGQLHVNLRGFDPSGHPMPAGEAIRGLLDGLGVDPATLPVELDAQAARYRSLVAGKRLLIVLDNARDIDQVIPLLPGSPSCAVLVTSRRNLAGLTTLHGARLIDLDVLPEPDARELLAQHLGPQRLAAEPQAVAELLAVCAGLPLAVAIVAARAAHHPDFLLAVLAEELRDVSARLDGLDAGDLRVNLRAVLSWSFRALSQQAANLFGLLGIAPGPDISLSAAASLTALTRGRVRTVLRELERASLVQQHVPGRYRMHDLIRLYATDTAHQRLSDKVRMSALRRVVDFYLNTAHSGERLLDPHRQPIHLDAPKPHYMVDEATALEWFRAEHANLLGTQQMAAHMGWHTQVWQLAWSLDNFHWRRGRLRDSVESWRAGLAAADSLGDQATRVRAMRLLGDAYARAGLPSKAVEHLEEALTLATQSEDRTTQANTHRSLAVAWAHYGEYQRALKHISHALHLYRVLNQPNWESAALNQMGWYMAHIGVYEQARDACEAALTLAQHHKNRTVEAEALDSLGYIAQQIGQHALALNNYQQARALYRGAGSAYYEAEIIDHIADAHHALGQYDDARTAWREALELYQEQGRDADAARVQQRLDNLDRTDGGRE